MAKTKKKDVKVVDKKNSKEESEYYQILDNDSNHIFLKVLFTIILLFGCLGAVYRFVILSPKAIFKSGINKTYDVFDKVLDKVNNYSKPLSVNGVMTFDSTDSNYNMLDDYKFILDYNMDISSNRYNCYLGINHNNIDEGSFKYLVDSNNLYINFQDIYDKYIKIGNLKDLYDIEIPYIKVLEVKNISKSIKDVIVKKVNNDYLKMAKEEITIKDNNYEFNYVELSLSKEKLSKLVGAVITDIKDDVATLKGNDVRLIANSPLDDLVICDEEERKDEFNPEIDSDIDLDRSDDNNFFYLPAKILHIDGDKDYLEKCLKFYRANKVWAAGYTLKENEIYKYVGKYLNDIKPDILIITGHDAFLKKDGNKNDLKNYKNTFNFIKAVEEARKYEKSHDKLLIIAGACQSNYEELIKAGADFASSPKRVNIHALDPAIIATNISLTEKNKEIDLLELLDKTRYGKDGMGGLIVNGLMYVGYPR